MRGFHRILIVWALIAGCRSVGGECPRFSAGHKVGKIELERINEASGLAASRKNPRVLWVHNDDGPACVYALTAEGKHLGRYNLGGARMWDWEDIAIGPGPDPNIDYLYVGSIGDNNSRRKSVTVYRVPEPNNVDVNQPPVTATIEGVEAIEMIYPDGPRNAETLMIDPLTKDIYIVSKEDRGGIYRMAYPQPTAGKTTLEYVARLPWGTATGGDISPDGQTIIVRNYLTASVWQRPKEGQLWQAFEGEECKVPLILEPQGEAICFDANGTGYYTTSEHKHQPIYYFARGQEK
jgi:hypothetical protein